MGILGRAIGLIKRERSMQRVTLALSRGALNASLRQIDPTKPNTWEFQAFSQNGEDGIVDYLCSKIRKPNRYFLEIGSSHGVENNTAFLAYARLFSGLMIDADTGGGGEKPCLLLSQPRRGGCQSLCK